jgi:hypothetical protein
MQKHPAGPGCLGIGWQEGRKAGNFTASVMSCKLVVGPQHHKMSYVLNEREKALFKKGIWGFTPSPELW